VKIIKKYIEYIKDNPNGYWFKRKVFGWGWVPASREGVLTTLIYVAVVLGLAFSIDENSSSEDAVFKLLIPLVLITIIFIIIAYKKGEKPKWQWGFPKEDKN